MENISLYKAQAQMIYWEGRDFGYKILGEMISNEQPVSLIDLEEAIYHHLISIPAYANYTILCESEARKAAKRVFEKFGTGDSQVFLSDVPMEK